MNISLTPNLEDFIRERANSGDYNNASEVVREALRLLRRTEEENALKIERLRHAIAVGDDALSKGEVIDISSGQELDRFFDEL